MLYFYFRIFSIYVSYRKYCQIIFKDIPMPTPEVNLNQKEDNLTNELLKTLRPRSYQQPVKTTSTPPPSSSSSSKSKRPVSMTALKKEISLDMLPTSPKLFSLSADNHSFSNVDDKKSSSKRNSLKEPMPDNKSDDPFSNLKLFAINRNTQQPQQQSKNDKNDYVNVAPTDEPPASAPPTTMRTLENELETETENDLVFTKTDSLNLSNNEGSKSSLLSNELKSYKLNIFSHKDDSNENCHDGDQSVSNNQMSSNNVSCDNKNTQNTPSQTNLIHTKQTFPTQSNSSTNINNNSPYYSSSSRQSQTQLPNASLNHRSTKFGHSNSLGSNINGIAGNDNWNALHFTKLSNPNLKPYTATNTNINGTILSAAATSNTTNNNSMNSYSNESELGNKYLFVNKKHLSTPTLFSYSAGSNHTPPFNVNNIENYVRNI